MSTTKKKIYIIAKEHFDIVWRRCFDRDFEFDGQNYVSYADLEGHYIKDNIELCKKYPFYNFEIESVAVLDKFLEHNPDYEDIIAEYIKEKKIYIPFSGINIVDSNMVNGESIIRNFLYGYYYLKNKYDYISDGIDRNDAFGNSAQIPQIVRGFGSKWLCHITYSNCTSPYWKGLDGSVVYNLEPKSIGSIGGYRKYRPCPVCNGYKNEHCDYCNDRRIDEPYMESIKFKLRLDEKAVNEEKISGYIYAGGEEVLPKEDIILWALENKDKYDIEFVSFKKYAELYADFINNVDNAPKEQIFSEKECNCNNTGCYVTRIKIKQGVRRLENSVFATEALAAANMLSGKVYPKDDFKKIWDKLIFTMFHDSLPATIVDPAYYEIMDSIEEAQNICDRVKDEQSVLITKADNSIITVFNPNGIKLSGFCEVELDEGYALEGVNMVSFTKEGGKTQITFEVKDIDAFESRSYKIVKNEEKYNRQILFAADDKIAAGEGILTNRPSVTAKENTISEAVIIENEFYKITAQNEGITEIFDKKLNRVISKASEYKIGEWILEHDEGSPWATLSPDMRRQPLSDCTKIASHEKTSDYQKITFKIVPGPVEGYSVSGLIIVYSLTLVNNCNKILFKSDVNWDTQNYRLRIAFPTELSGKHMYEIPYGMIERKPYEHNIVFENGSTNWASAAGDYPAINWAGIEGDGASIALFNKGTPSYQINTDKYGKQNILLTVLRSPSVGTYLHCPLEYSMTDYDGMRDAGDHSFEYALKVYDNGFGKNSVVADGIGYNTRFIDFRGNADIAQLPKVLTDNARISALIPAHNSKGMIMRVAEYRGRSGELQIKLPDNIKSVCETDMKEDVISDVYIENNTFGTAIRSFEIKTFYLEL